MSKPFFIIHTNVDGSGKQSDHDTLREAKAEADRLQIESNEHGNPWGYLYHVYELGREGKLYDTRHLAA